MRTRGGDPAFQVMVLRHRASQVAEYASLSAQADQDCRRVRTAVDAIAHPEKLQRSRLGAEQRETLAQLRSLASAASWSALADTARQLLSMPAVSAESSLERGLRQLLDGHELAQLQRLANLASDELVQEYRSLWDRQGPRSGSPAAAAQGSAAQRRGAAVEAAAAQALAALAKRMNEAAENPATYRVVTSMRVPSSFPGSTDRAKSEWDAVLLQQAAPTDQTPVWDVRLLVEVKASVDAATADFPRLLRGLQLLTHADPQAVYSFATQQGEVRLRGASLAALSTDCAALSAYVLYCCDVPPDAAPRLLSASTRMQLLSAEASLAFAGKLATGQPADPLDLDPVWQAVVESPRWVAVLNQYPMLQRVRALMVHIADLSAAIDANSLP